MRQTYTLQYFLAQVLTVCVGPVNAVFDSYSQLIQSDSSKIAREGF